MSLWLEILIAIAVVIFIYERVADAWAWRDIFKNL